MTLQHAFHKIALVTIVAAGVTVGPATAQEATGPSTLVSAFSGDWFSFDTASSSAGATCSIRLDSDLSTADPSVEVSGCAPPLDQVTTWRIEDGQIRLQGGEGQSDIVSLGGTQFRITGDLADSDRSLILERPAGDASANAIRDAVAEYRCLFRGFSSECADEEDLIQPEFDENGQSQIQTIVNLNARNQPRSDAPVVGVVPANTSIVVDQCLVASDGLWCQARFSEQSAWFRRTAIRDETWPILTFVSASGE